MIFKKNDSTNLENIKHEPDNRINERYSPDIKKKSSPLFNTFKGINFNKQDKDNTNNLINTDVTSLAKLKNMNKASPIKLHAITSSNDNNNIINIHGQDEKVEDYEDIRNSDFFMDKNDNINDEPKQKIECQTERERKDTEEKYTPFSK